MNNTINLVLALVLGIVIGYLFFGKKGAASSSGSVAEVDGFQLTDLPDGTTHAIKNTTDGIRAEEGTLIDGKKSGAWIEYYTKDGRVKSITNYANGKKNGLQIQLSDRGQTTAEGYYKDDKRHGKQSTFKFGSRLVKEVEYNMGIEDGMFKEYNNQGKIQKERYFKNGVLDGVFKQYNENGDVILEYLYENGQQVSGGMVEKQSE